MLHIPGFISGAARGGFCPPPPMEVFVPLRNWLNLHIEFGHAYRDKSNSGLYNTTGLFQLPPP